MKKLIFTAALLLSFVFIFSACNNNKSTKTEQVATDEMYTCTMHNEVMSDRPGDCPKCGMKLEKQKMTAEQQKMMKEGTYEKPKE